MTGNTLRHFKRALDDAREAFGPVDVWPADPTERAADKLLRKAMVRPVRRPPVPWMVPFLFGAAAMALAVALAAFAVDAVQTGAATAVEAERVAGW
jgi:hypothetical protein